MVITLFKKLTRRILREKDLEKAKQGCHKKHYHKFDCRLDRRYWYIRGDKIVIDDWRKSVAGISTLRRVYTLDGRLEWKLSKKLIDRRCGIVRPDQGNVLLNKVEYNPPGKLVGKTVEALWIHEPEYFAKQALKPSLNPPSMIDYF